MWPLFCYFTSGMSFVLACQFVRRRSEGGSLRPERKNHPRKQQRRSIIKPAMYDARRAALTMTGYLQLLWST